MIARWFGVISFKFSFLRSSLRNSVFLLIKELEWMIVVKSWFTLTSKWKCAWNRHFGILYFSRVVSQKKIVIALFYFSPSLFFWFQRYRAWEILVTQPGIRPCPLQWKCRVFTHWTTREFPYISFLTKNILLCWWSL